MPYADAEQVISLCRNVKAARQGDAPGFSESDITAHAEVAGAEIDAALGRLWEWPPATGVPIPSIVKTVANLLTASLMEDANASFVSNPGGGSDLHPYGRILASRARKLLAPLASGEIVLPGIKKLGGPKVSSAPPSSFRPASGLPFGGVR